MHRVSSPGSWLRSCCNWSHSQARRSAGSISRAISDAALHQQMNSENEHVGQEGMGSAYYGW